MKKIMHIIKSAGGVERYIQMFLKNIGKEKYENILVCSYDYHEEDYKDLVSSFEHVDMQRSINLRADLKAICAIRKLIKTYRPDIIYVHSSKAGALGRIADLGINNKVVYNPHGWAFNMDCGKNKQKIYEIIEWLLASVTDRIVAISEREKQSALEHKICKLKKLQVIYNGIDIKQYEKEMRENTLTRSRLGIRTDAYIIGMVGRLSKQKAPDVFIKAAARIKKKIPNAFFMIVGDGSERNELEMLIKQYGLEASFYITGWVENPISYIKLFDQAMLLSRWEGFGLVLAEYMCAEKPIIATNIDAIPNLITDHKNGILVECDNIEQVAKNSESLFENRKLALKLATEGKKIVKERFTIDRVVQDHMHLFEQL